MAEHQHALGGKPLTKNQRLVLERLEKTEGPLSAYSILDELRDEGFRAPLQVYRALDKLVDAGLVHRLESLNAFVACRHPSCHSHRMIGFAICEECGSVQEFSQDRISEELVAWARDDGFRLKKTTIELRGLCKTCAEQAPLQS
ncbi:MULTISPECIES: Fur family transcriptional regulator [Pseudovibrio]|uniref:Fur family transcriptional regulator n=1 Tax=Stappiaceae TaxID=2821832 RepID=UPI00236595EB|nr:MULTISPECIES: Fur family transcriptional regulator [Pseudovibrio]MDD7909615.1 Fur family transcriptional regulator [Pseudovibrio exalbescens]MDX5591941.1 Fur family transcriptional regulator [Pseudovibrio sp. SPO723]